MDLLFILQLPCSLTHRHRALILNDLIAFANQYESLEKRLLDDLALPYAIMDTNGRMILVKQSICNAYR